MLFDERDATERAGRTEILRLAAVFLLALAAIGVAAALGSAGRADPAPPPAPTVPDWCEGPVADACGRWDPPLDP